MAGSRFHKGGVGTPERVSGWSVDPLPFGLQKYTTAEEHALHSGNHTNKNKNTHAAQRSKLQASVHVCIERGRWPKHI